MSMYSKRAFTERRPDIHCNYLHGTGIDIHNFPQEFFPIVGIFAEDCDYHLKDLHISFDRLFIRGYNKGKSNELLLRFGESNLLVSRIEFIHQRQGNMTRLYEILKRIRKNYRLNPIVIEYCLTEESINWSIKNGLMPVTHEEHTSYREKE